MIKILFFDFDGVIAESVDIKTRAFGKLFEHEGPEVVKKVVEYHKNNTGVSRYDKFRYFYSEILKRPLGNAEFEKLCGSFAKLVIEEVVKAPFVNGAREFLNTYSSKYSNYIVSATPQKEIEEIIEKKYITGCFAGIFGSPTEKKEAVKKTLAKTGTTPSNALYVGDARSDYEAAKANGIHFVARVVEGDNIFGDISCLKVKDLTGLEDIVEKL